MMIAILIAAAGLVPDPQLVSLLAGVRASVPDAREIADLQICPRPRDALVAFSRPRQARAYYRVQWRDGGPARLTDLQIAGDSQGLGMIAARQLERRFESCGRVISADELEAGWSALDRH